MSAGRVLEVVSLEALSASLVSVAFIIGVWFAVFFPLRILGFFDFVGGAVADKDWLASPFDNDLLSKYQIHSSYCVVGA